MNDNRKGTVAYGDYWLLLARIGMASLFLFSGFEKVVRYHDFVGFATSGGLPIAATVAPFVIFAEIAGSFMLILGWNARAAAIFFAGFCAILGPWFHQFWNASPERWQESVDGFFHHFVMAGGFVLLAIHGPGTLSLDGRREKKVSDLTDTLVHNGLMDLTEAIRSRMSCWLPRCSRAGRNDSHLWPQPVVRFSYRPP